MVDKGADLSWLSQYPHEAEICFPPLTGLELRNTRIAGSILICELDPRLHAPSAAADLDDAVVEFIKMDVDQSGQLEAVEFSR